MASRFGAAAGQIVVRLYALAIALVVAWAVYASVAYLFRSVFTPTDVPQRFLDWPARLDADALRRGDVAGVSREAPRAPLGHYHGVDRWFQPDPHNGCTIAGCHSALPHAKRKELRAFANFHAMFLTCQMCHEERAAGPVAARWASTSTGTWTQPPAVLRLMRYIEMEAGQIQDAPYAARETMVSLLSEAVEVTGSAVLEYLTQRIDAAEPGSPLWQHTLARVKEELPAHVRGEYGEKLSPAGPGNEPHKLVPQMAEAEQAMRDVLKTSKPYEAAYQRAHAGIVAKPSGCIGCHGGEPPLLDFESLGYSPARASYLRSTPIAKQIQHIQQGHEFYIPRILEGANGR
jgi:mono/diheme cytochrome c family protein